uniref:hypothetical protein n=1 Tax=Segatella hominis TaxID=2518605 RepID=UPI004029AF68
MKRIYFIFVIFLVGLLPMKAQSENVQRLSDGVTQIVGSFMDNPYHHENTVKIYNLTQTFMKTVDEIYDTAIGYSIYSDDAKNDLVYLRNLKGILECLDFITANIVGYSRNGMETVKMDTYFNNMISSFGWTREVVYSSVPDLVVYEYCKDNFKMALVLNTRLKKEMSDFNCNRFECYTINPYNKQDYAFTVRYVFGGNYQFVVFGDDSQKYKKITKVTTHRGLN